MFALFSEKYCPPIKNHWAGLSTGVEWPPPPRSRSPPHERGCACGDRCRSRRRWRGRNGRRQSQGRSRSLKSPPFPADRELQPWVRGRLRYACQSFVISIVLSTSCFTSTASFELGS